MNLRPSGYEQTESTPVFNDELGDFIDEANCGRWWRNFAIDHGFGRYSQDVRTN